MNRHCCWSVLIFLVAASAVAADHFHIAVKGSVFCKNETYLNAEITLWDYDFLYPDVELASGRTNNLGKFHVEGDRYELFAMIPYFTVTGKCDKKIICMRYWVPQDYVWVDGYPKKMFHAGMVNLSRPYDADSC